jgi:phosphonate transport system substrate-binding protein
MVPSHSPIKSLTDLSGRRMAFVDIMSASGYVVPKEALVRAGVTGSKNVQAQFYDNHVDAVQAVLSGKADAVATYDLIFNDSKNLAQRRHKLKVLWTGEFVIPSDAFVATDAVSAADQQRIRVALLSYFADQERGLYPKNGVYEGFVSADPNLYNDLKRFLNQVGSR